MKTFSSAVQKLHFCNCHGEGCNKDWVSAEQGTNGATTTTTTITSSTTITTTSTITTTGAASNSLVSTITFIICLIGQLIFRHLYNALMFIS